MVLNLFSIFLLLHGAVAAVNQPPSQWMTLNDLEVDRIATEYPATTVAYFRSPCSDMNAKLPYTILPIEPGNLLSLAPPDALPPVQPPAPALEAADVVDTPQPPVADLSDNEEISPANSPPASDQRRNTAHVALCLLMAMLSFLCLSYH